MSERPGRRAALLAAAVALVYSPVLTAPVLYDDLPHVRDNPVFSLPFGAFWLGLVSREHFAFVGERTYQPLVALFHYFAHGLPALCRVAGWGLHAANAALVYEISRRLTGRPRAAALAAALFAAFPAHTEALNFSAFKGHALAAFFVLAVIVGVMELCSERGAGDRRLPLALACLFAFALLSKESGLVAAPLAAVYAILFAREKPGRLKTAAFAFAVLSGGYLAWRFLWLAPPPAFPVRFEYSPLRSLAFYARELAVPYPPCLEHTLSPGGLWPLWLAALAVAAWGLRRSRESLFALAWIVVALLPVLHLIPFSNVSPVADRYLYLPAAGLCLLLAHVFGASVRGERALAVLALVWAGLSFSRNLDYRSARGLFEQTARCAPDNARAHFLAGNARFADKDYPAARASYERVLELTDSKGAREALAETERRMSGAAGNNR